MCGYKYLKDLPSQVVFAWGIWLKKILENYSYSDKQTAK